MPLRTLPSHAGHEVALVSAGPGLLTAELLVAMAFLAGGRTQPHSSQQHTHSFVATVAEAQGLAFVTAPDRHPQGKCWEVRNGLPCLSAPLPSPPSDPNPPVYAIGENQFLADQTAGPLVGRLPSACRKRTLSRADYASILEA